MLLLNTPPAPSFSTPLSSPCSKGNCFDEDGLDSWKKKEAAKLKLPIQWFCGWTNFSPSNLIVKEFLWIIGLSLLKSH